MNTEPGEREEAPERVWITWDDAYPWETPEMGGDEYIRADLAATRMRGRCVEKVKEYFHYSPATCEALINALESLTLDGEKEQ